jgi:Zn-finger nucleic acid-binding protein
MAVTPEGAFWRCATCSGMAANIAVLRKSLGAETVRQFWLKATTESMPSIRKCPSCAQMLREFAADLDAQRIHLDLCKGCQLMWFDRNELEAFPKAEKSSGRDAPWSFAIPTASFENQFEDEGGPADNYANFIMDILCLIIRLILFRS